MNVRTHPRRPQHPVPTRDGTFGPVSRNAAARLLATLCGTLLFVTGCAAPAHDMGVIGEDGHPVLVVAYTPNTTVRLAFEEQLERDLAARGITALPSLRVTPDFSRLNHADVLDAAAGAQAPMVLMVRRMIIPGDPATLGQRGGQAPTQRHRSLRDYFALVSRDRLPEIPPAGREVIEVAGYLRQEDASDAELVWNGISWVDFDGDLGAAISETAEIIATNMASARDTVRQRR